MDMVCRDVCDGYDVGRVRCFFIVIFWNEVVIFIMLKGYSYDFG